MLVYQRVKGNILGGTVEVTFMVITSTVQLWIYINLQQELHFQAFPLPKEITVFTVGLLR